MGPNTLTLTGANTFTGPVSLIGGTLNVAALNNLGNGTALNFDGGTLQFSGVFDPSVRTITFQASGGTIDTQGYNIVLAHSIGNGGSGGLTKLGSGTLTLSASANYSGATTISNGTLQLASAGSLPANAAVSLTANTAKLDLNGISQNIAYLNGLNAPGCEIKLGGATLSAGTYSSEFDGSITSTSGGSLTKVGTSGWLTLTGVNTYSGNTLVNQGVLIVGQAATLPGYSVAGKVSVSSGAALVVRTGGTGEWTESQIMTLQNTVPFDSSTAFGIDTTNGDATFGSSGGTLTGSLNFLKVGNNTLLLTGNNTYTGNTVVYGGTLTASETASLPGYNASGIIYVDPGATLAVRAGGTGEWAASDIGALITNATFYINTNVTPTVYSYFGIDTTGGPFTYGNVISQGQGLTKLGSNTLTLTAANTFTGPVNLSAGLINVSALNNLGNGTELDFNGGGLQFAAAFDPSVRTMSFQADAIIDTQGNTVTFANPVGNGGNGGLTKLGSGTLVLAATNAFYGDVNFNAGLVNASSLGNLGNGQALNFNGGGLQFGAAFDVTADYRAITFQSGNAVFDTQAFNVTLANSIGGGGAGGLNKKGPGMLTLLASPDYQGPTVINAGTLQLASPDSGATWATLPDTAVNLTASGATLDANGFDQTIASLTGVVGTLVKLGGSTLTTGDDNTSTTFAGVISSVGAGSLTKTGSGTLILTGSNTFMTAANFNGGVIEAASLSNLGNAAALNFNGGGLRFDAAFDPSLNGRAITIQAGGAVLDTQTFNVTIANSIGNGGAGGLDKKGSGMLTLSASPTYKGGTTVNAGTLQLASGAVLPATAVNLTATGATLDANGISQTIGSLAGAAGTEFKLGGSTLTTGGDNTSTTFAGLISSATGGTLTKIGTGTFTLTGSNNTFSGPVNFNGGLINASSLSSLGVGTALNFNGGGLQFAGVFDPSSRTMTFQSGQAVLDTQANTIKLANAIGNNGAGGLDKTGSGILELDGKVTYTGATTIDAGVLKIDNNQSTTLGAISGAGTLEVDGASTILTATSINVGTLTLSPGAEVVIAALPGGPRQDLVITPVTAPNSVLPVPEPSLLTLIGMAALAMLFAAQGKRSKKSV